ncbi:MAG: hypothetical protein M3144_04685 [Actinomycetota bacterium]|nr:hypothetical protein [Actinomycetota bacterium]
MLLLTALTFVPFHWGGPAPSKGGQAGRTAVHAPDALVGLAAALVVAGTVTWLALTTLLPRPPVPHPGRALLPLAGCAFGLVLLKLVLDPHRLANGAWLSLALALAWVAASVASNRHPAPERRHT